MKPPLMSISEEDLESNTSTAFRSILSPSDSVASTADESDYRTVSQHDSSATSTAGADTDTSLMLDSLPSQHSLDSSAESSRNYREEEFSSINTGNEGQEPAETSKTSPELLELNQNSSGAVYVGDKDKLEFAEQLKELRQQQSKPENNEANVDRGERICFGPDLVAFNNNAPSPEEMKEQTGEPLDEVAERQHQTTESVGVENLLLDSSDGDKASKLIEACFENPFPVSLGNEKETLEEKCEQPDNQNLVSDLLENVQILEVGGKPAPESAKIQANLIDIGFSDSSDDGFKEMPTQDLMDEIDDQISQPILLHVTKSCLETTKAIPATTVETAEADVLQNVDTESTPLNASECTVEVGNQIDENPTQSLSSNEGTASVKNSNDVNINETLKNSVVSSSSKIDNQLLETGNNVKPTDSELISDPNWILRAKLVSQEIILEQENVEDKSSEILADVSNARLCSEQQIVKQCQKLETSNLNSNDESEDPGAKFLQSISEESTFSSSTSDFTSPESVKSAEHNTTVNKLINDKSSASDTTPTSTVDSADDLSDCPNIESSEKLQLPPSDRTQPCETTLDHLSPTPGSEPNPPDVLLGTAETLDESDSEHLKSNDGLPNRSGSSSPTDTSLEAVAGSIDRASSPEESYSALPPEETSNNSNEQLLDLENLFPSSRNPTPDGRRHSTPIAIVTQQMRQYCEELKGILYPQKSPEPTKGTESGLELLTPENLKALQSLREELRMANEDPSQCEVKPCKDHPIQTISPTINVPVSETLLTPMEEFALKTAKYNHFLRNIDYVEESSPIAEEVECLLTQSVDKSTIDDIVRITPSAEEHAVGEPIVVEHPPTPEPAALTQDSYERQITATVGELEPVNHPTDPFDSSPQPLPEVLEKDTEMSSLPIPLATVSALTNNSDTNLSITVEPTNNSNNQQPPTFLSEASISFEEPDLSQSQPIPAQSESDKQATSELVNGHDVPTATNGSTDDSGEEEKLIPGSIAEREHLKWRNASPIANNPYSPDVLQKRLEESNRKSSLSDLDRLADRVLTSPTQMEVPDEPELVSASKDEDDSAEKDRSLQSVVGANPNRYLRYGRDYYINDAKRACGTRKQTLDLSGQLTHSTDDEKSLLLSQKQDQPTGPTESHHGNDLHPADAFPVTKSNSSDNVVNKHQSEDIFSAGRPIAVAAHDPILKKGTKVDYLSTQSREIYLVPADEPITSCSLGSSSEHSMNSRADESLTFSEDSDVTRIYEIGTCESKMIHGDAIGSEKDPSRTPPTTPTANDDSLAICIDEEQTMNKLNSLKLNQENELVSEEIIGIIPQVRMPTPVDLDPIEEPPSSPTIDRSRLLKPHLVKMKPLSPETIKFFSPKKPFASKGGNLSQSSSLSQSSMEIRDLPQQPSSHYHSSLHIDYPPSRTTPLHHDFIIEKEVMEVLPSVKELAKCYSGSHQDVSAAPLPPLHKPRDFIRQSSDMLHEEENQETRTGMPQVQNKNRRMYCSTSSISAAEEIRRMKVEAYNPPTYVPMAPGHSITARSLSKQIRDELKTNATDDHKVQGTGHTSPERPSSPVFAPGHLRSSIQFFENLKK